MDDADPEQFRKNQESWDRNTDALNALNRALNNQSNNNKQRDDDSAKKYKSYTSSIGGYTSKFNSYVDSLSGGMKTLGGSADHLVASFASASRSLIGGAVIGELVKAGYELNKTYKDMTGIGQTFGGSMLEMASQAGAAGLPLSQFTQMLKNNSTAAATLANGNKATLGSLQLAVRDVTKDFGFYGMSLNDIAEVTGDYTETMRQQGRLGKINNQTTSQDIADFSKDITEFSKVTGVARGEIAKMTMKAMQDVAFTSRDLSDAQEKTATRAIAFMASLPGSAGPMLSKMLSQTIGYGSSLFADDMKKFADVGGGDFLSIMDEIGQKAQRGAGFSDRDAGDELTKMQGFFRDHNESLRIQAMSNGPNAQNARDLLALGNSLKGLTAEEYAEKKRQTNAMGGLTLMFSQFEDQLSRLSGAFIEGLMEPLKDLEKSFGSSVPIFDTFKDTAKNLGKALGTWLKEILNPVAINKFKEILLSLPSYINPVIDVFKDLSAGIKWIYNGLVGLNTFLTGAFGAHTAHIIEGVLAAFVLFPGKMFGLLGGIGSLVKSIFGLGTVSIKAGVVNVSGGLGGGGVHGGGTNPHGTGGRGTGAHPNTAHAPHATPPTGGKKGWRKWLSGAFGFAEEAAGSVLGGGGGDCCNGLMSGIESLTDRVDFHGDRAHENASKAGGVAEEVAHDARPLGTAARETEAAAEASSKLGFFGRISKGLGSVGSFLGRHAGKIGAVGSVIDGGVSAYDEYQETGRAGRAVGVGAATAAGAGLGAAGGAALGAAIGTAIFPVVGTAIGGLVGLAGGLLGGYFGGKAGGALARGADDLIEGAPGSAAPTPATPATPSADQATNPFDGDSDDSLTAKMNDVAQAIKDNQDAQAHQQPLIEKLDAQNVMMKELIRLQEEAKQIKAAQDKKATELARRQTVAAEATAVAAGS